MGFPSALGKAAVAAAAAGVANSAPSVAVLGQWTPLRRVGPLVWRGPSRPGAPVAVTFDDGPSRDVTPVLLDRLERLGWRATFFTLGEAVARHPELVAEAAARGHQVETHGYRHRHHLLSPPWEVVADLRLALEGLGALGITPRWFRPPYGQVSAGTLLAARRARLGLALWSAWGREWATDDAGAVGRRVASGLAPGAIILLHDSDATSPPGSARRALCALDHIAAEVDRRGLRAAVLDEAAGG
jgi:peptidoglycan/xylan/chitin deacetylase (PgdA/CDA1 family)